MLDDGAVLTPPPNQKAAKQALKEQVNIAVALVASNMKSPHKARWGVKSCMVPEYTRGAILFKRDKITLLADSGKTRVTKAIHVR